MKTKQNGVQGEVRTIANGSASARAAAMRDGKARTKLLIALGVVVVGGGVLVGLAPTIASKFAPGIIQNAAGKAIKGTVTVQSASLSWGGPQVIGPITLSAPGADGKDQVATLSVTADTALTSLIAGGKNLGTVTVDGAKISVVRYQDGTTNLQKAIESVQPAAPASGSGGSGGSGTAAPASGGNPLEGLKVKLSVKNLVATFTDMASAEGKGGSGGSSTIELNNVNLNAEVDSTKPLALDLTGTVVDKAAGANGTLDVKAKADNWQDGKGNIDVANATLDVNATAQRIPVGLIDAFVGPIIRDGKGQAVSLKSGLGNEINLAITAKGNSKKASANVNIAAANASVVGPIDVTDGVVTTPQPMTISVKGEAIRTLVPAIRESLDQQQQARFDRFPDATVTLGNLRVKLPANGQPMDFRGVSANATVALSELTGALALQPGQPMRALQVAPLTISATTEDLAKGLRVVGGSNATLGGQNAGQFVVDVTAGSLLDAKGALVGGMPRDLSGTVQLRGLTTAILQPFVESTGLNMARDVGATLDMNATAVSVKDASGNGSGVPPMDLTLDVRASELTVQGAVRVSPTRITVKDQPLVINANSFVPLAMQFMKPKPGEPGAGWALSVPGGSHAEPPGRAFITVQELDATLGEKGVDLGTLTLRANGRTSTFATAPVPSAENPVNGAPITVWATSFKADLKPGGSGRVEAVVDAQYDGRNFNNVIAFDLANLIGADGAFNSNLATLKASGGVEVKNVPTSILRAVVAAPTRDAAGKMGLDLAGLVSDFVGQTASVSVNTAPAGVGAQAADIKVNAERLTLTTRATLSAKEIALAKSDAAMDVTPASLTSLLTALEVQGAPRLLQNSRAVLAINPVTIPLDADGSMRLDQVGATDLSLTLPGKTIVDGLQLKNDDGSVRSMGRVGVQDLVLQATLPVGGLIPAGTGPKAKPAGRGELKASFRGGVVGGPNGDQSLLAINGTAKGLLSGGVPAGPLTVNAAVENINAGLIDSTFAQEGKVTGLLGGNANAGLAVVMTPAAGKAFSAETASIDAEMTLSAPNIKTSGPIKVAVLADRFQLKQPATINAVLEPAFVNAMINAPGPNGPVPADQRLDVTQRVKADIELGSFTLPRGTSTAGLSVQANANLNDLLMQQGAGAKQNQIALKGTKVDVRSAGAGAVQFKASIDQAGLAAGPFTPMVVDGVVSKLIDANGGFSMERATASAKSDMPAIPTALIDALARQDGLLVELLGPMVACKFDIVNYPLGQFAGDAGTIDFTATSERATAALKGNIGGEGTVPVLTATQPVEIKLFEVTRALSDRFVEGLPMVDEILKTREDAPAFLKVTNLTLPLGKDYSKLNADIAFDPGEMRYNTSNTFTKLLDLAKVRKSGVVGQKIEPLAATIRNGVATLPRYRVPLGEFTVETEGTLNLVNDQMDVVTYIPFAALADNAVGLFKKGGLSSIPVLGDVFKATTMMPFRTKGTFANNSTDAAPDMILENLQKEVDPEKVIKGIGDLFKKKEKAPPK